MQKLKILCLILIFGACGKEKGLENCNKDLVKGIFSEEIGEYYDEHHHALTIDLDDEICIITRNYIRIYPYDQSEPNYVLNAKIFGAVVNEYDTIIQMNNSFKRFYPSTRAYEHLYTPPFTIHSFCVTPNHGIGYIWGNIFVENRKFNYFTFEENKTLFEYHTFIPGYPKNQPAFYQTYLDSGVPHLFLITSGLSTIDPGSFYKVDLNDTVIIKQKVFPKHITFSILDPNDFEKIDAIHSYPDSKIGGVSTLNLTNLSKENVLSFELNWLKTRYHIDQNFVALTYLFSHETPHLTKLYNWKTGQEFFSVETPIEFRSAHTYIHNFNDEIVLLYNKKLNRATGFDKQGCKIFKLNSKNFIESIVYMDNKKVITKSDQDFVGIFRLD